ncbi:MAG: lysophospholipid acyltransferase family protein [Endomicrobiia bacterium]
MFKIFPTIYFYSNLFFLIFKAYFKLIFKKFFWQDFVKYSKKVLEIIKNFETKVIIEENNELLKISYPVIFISNHMSSLETLLFGYILGRYTKITFILKKSLLYYPIFGKILKFLDPIAVSRNNPRKDFRLVLKKYEILYKNKVSLVVFPQATRSLNIEDNKFSSIGIKIAKIFNIGIVPIFVKTDFLSIGKIIKDIGIVNTKKNVYIKIFPYIPAEKINKNTNQQIVEILKKELAKYNFI